MRISLPPKPVNTRDFTFEVVATDDELGRKGQGVKFIVRNEETGTFENLMYVYGGATPRINGAFGSAHDRLREIGFIT